MKVSPIKVIKSDFLAIISLIAPIVSIILYIDAAYFGFFSAFLSKDGQSVPTDPSIFLIIAIAATVIFIPILFFRIKKINDHFENGIEAKGKIIEISLHKDRGRIEYEYEVDGESYTSGNAVHKSKFVSSLKEGDEVALVVSKKNPKKAYIKDMYIAK